MANTLIDVALDQTWTEVRNLKAVYKPKERAKIYDAEAFDQLETQANASNAKCKEFFELFVKEGTESYFENLHAYLSLLHIDDQLIPLLVPDTKSVNTYVCSPYGHYVQLPLSLCLVKNPSGKAHG